MACNSPDAGCREFRRLRRRDLLRIGSLGLLGLSLPEFLAAAEKGRIAPRARSVLFYHHYGAPSHIDTFDPKPLAPVEVRGEFATIASAVPAARAKARDFFIVSLLGNRHPSSPGERSKLRSA